MAYVLLLLTFLAAGLVHSAEDALTDSVLDMLDTNQPADTQPWRFSFPRDHQVHSAPTSERWQLLAVLKAQNGSEYLANIRMLRLQLDATPPLQPENSRWFFDEVYAIAARVLDQSRPLLHAQTAVSRAALGLAGSDSQSGRTWVNQHSLTLAGAAGCQLSAEGEFVFAGLSLRFKAHGTACPATETAAGVAAAYQQALSFESGQLDGHAIVSGQGWLLRGWGALPPAGAPVVFDRFYILLDDNRLLRVLRSRRRDGSGAAVMSAELIQAGLRQSIDYQDLSLSDNGSWQSGPGGEHYSAGWTLAWPGHHAQLKPLLAEQELEFLGQAQWAGALEVRLESRSQPESVALGAFAELAPLAPGPQSTGRAEP